MKVRYLDKRTRNFISYAILLLILIIILIGLFTYVYMNFTLSAYNVILGVLIGIFTVLAVIVALSMLSVLHVHSKRKTNRIMIPFVKLGLKLIIPAAVSFAQFFGKDKDAIRSFYVDINNLIAESPGICYKPGDILLILPHCLQDSKCGYKITNDINNCRQCGNCVMGEILGIVRERGVKTIVVTGGTAARNIVMKEKPRMLLSVACERDLTSGIMDINKLPVITRMPVVGLLNERPNGPCLNTMVDVDVLASKLDMLLGRNATTAGAKD